MSEADLPILALAEVGQEKQILGLPGGPLRAVGGGALLPDDPAQDAAQGHDGQALRIESHEEDAPRLADRQRAQTLDLENFCGARRIDSELLRGVFEGDWLEVVAINGPAHLVAKIADE